MSDHRYILIGLRTNVEIGKASIAEETYPIMNYFRLSKKLPKLEQSIDFNTFCTNLNIEANRNICMRPISKKIENLHLYPYFTEEIKTIRKLRNKFYRLKNKHPNIAFYKTNFIHYKYLLLKKLESERQKYYSAEISKVVDNPKKLWVKIREIVTHKKNFNEKTSIILKHNNILY